MVKLNNTQKQKIAAGAGAKIAKSAMFESIIGMQMGGNSINNFLNLINQIIFYSNPDNRKLIAQNYSYQHSFIRGSAYASNSTINMG